MPDFMNATVRAYLDQLASGAPTPGGGSAAGLTGAMAAALLAMSARFTVGREKYAAFDEAATAVLGNAEALRAELQRLVEEDAAAYGLYGAALALPKETDAEKAARRQALQDATRAAILPPLAIARHTYRLLELAGTLAEHCNPNLVSDVAVAAYLARSAFRSAAVNVRLNLAYLKDADYVQQVSDELTPLELQAPQLARTALESSFGAMNLPFEGEVSL